MMIIAKLQTKVQQSCTILLLMDHQTQIMQKITDDMDAKSIFFASLFAKCKLLYILCY